ncbi:ribbon-helix-helix domain-containing protein [Wenzhouxiangella sp. EGI_FJ10305]|uniref:ribbon-helix-helix domain-containing protein n=1 Tax=Wenzhouxiangella sp. EGI_FJ10305 TaxID=3243768 RepID=UPI0035D6C897
MTSKYRITVNLSEDEYQELAQLAAECAASRAWICRRAIKDLLDCQRKVQPALPLDAPYSVRKASND